MLLSKIQYGTMLLLTQKGQMPKVLTKRDLYKPENMRILKRMPECKAKLWLAGVTLDGKPYAAQRVVIDGEFAMLAQKAESEHNRFDVEYFRQLVFDKAINEQLSITEIARRIGTTSVKLQELLSGRSKVMLPKMVSKVTAALELDNNQVRRLLCSGTVQEVRE